MRAFDLIVIGGGTGTHVAAEAAKAGMKTALVEKGPIGGTCLNRGCVPSKMLIRSAEALDEAARAQEFGVGVRGRSADFAAIIARSRRHVEWRAKQLEEGLAALPSLSRFGCECWFTGPKTVSCGGEEMRAEKILIAAGSSPSLPRVEGLAESRPLTSDGALWLDSLPPSLAIIGGGAVSVELAYFFGALGSRVTTIHRNQFLLNREDGEVARAFTALFGKRFGLRLGCEPVEVSREGGAFRVSVRDAKGAAGTVESAQLLAATGRKPNSAALSPEKAGVETDARGYIPHDEFMETNVKGIYAIGDIGGRFQFKHSGDEEARVAVANIVRGERREMDYSFMPHAIFSSPQVAALGKTEEELRGEGAPFVSGKAGFGNRVAGRIVEDYSGFVKVLAEPGTGKLLGCHIVGTGAASLINEVSVAARCGGGTAACLARAVRVYPTLSGFVRDAADDALSNAGA
jgi:dihydrolipoamide dehydrogenase